ncbi:MAG TPA: hypothetical protein VJH03_18760 [Blastocatellia bacterium]|nr:hypothetical protein [Blastocatellia bacterium]
MTLINETDSESVKAILTALKSETGATTTLQGLAQGVMEQFRAVFTESVVLARTYATVPYKLLPERDRAFVQNSVRGKGKLDLLTEETKVLSLLGTSGVDPAWCDRYRSQDHLGVPLLSPEFVAGIPMVAGLIRDLGSSADWYARTRPSDSSDNFGVFAESFFVPDAATCRDDSGRLLIPAQDFVRAHGVRAVLGVGGQFGSTGMILVCIFFTREAPSPTTAKWLMRLPLVLGTVSLPFVSSGRIYTVGVFES